MKMAFDAKRAFTNDRGLGNYARNLLNGFFEYADPKNEYHLFTPEYENAPIVDWLPDKKNISIHTPRGVIGRLWSPYWRSFKISSELNEIGANLYHGLSNEIPYSLHECSACKKVVTIHDLLFMRYPQYFPFIDQKVYANKVQFAIKNSDLVLAISEQTKSDLCELLKAPEEKIEVCYQSCSPNFYRPANEHKKNRVKEHYHLPHHFFLYNGALEKRKNVLFLLKVFKRIKHKVEHSLVLVGKGGEYQDMLQSFIQENDLSYRVHILNNVPDDDLPLIYQMATLFLFPSFYEGFGIPIAQSLFSSLPVVTTEGSCFHEVGGPQTLYLSPHDESLWEKSILDLVSNVPRRKQMALTGREYAERFHLKYTTERTLELYSGLF